MAAVPTGPSSTLPTSPTKITPFPGNGCDALGEGSDLVSILNDSVTSDKEQEQKNNECERDRTKSPKYLFSHAHNLSQTTEQQVNGLTCSTEDDFSHSHTENTSDELTSSMDNRANRTGDSNSNDHHEDGLCFTCHHPHTNNNCVNDMFSSSGTETSHIHTVTGDAEDIKDVYDQANVFTTYEPPLNEEGNSTAGSQLLEPVSKEAAQAPVAELARLELNRESGSSEEIRYVRYESELQMPGIMRLITKDLSEPYSIYTYRYFIHNWPQLCFLAMVEQECVGAIVCKLDMHKKMFRRGYIAMLAVDSKHRRKSIGTNLVKKAIYAMVEGDCDEVVLETEITNKSALKLYENLGFVRDKRLFRYYLNGVDALRLKLWLR
ncbi:N-alpha-acetyltransferase 30A-like [Chanos chanos]|uniref:N-alpha-acetyltransferase 30 n=1 Tax=Chanos chanos TaxID=29144 RepID=A0A6J2V8D1_CHACN|nr:N-alpha-acetyltransferase 30A-like [Chanos chanos]